MRAAVNGVDAIENDIAEIGANLKRRDENTTQNAQQAGAPFGLIVEHPAKAAGLHNGYRVKASS